jgi:hypothetical protein
MKKSYELYNLEKLNPAAVLVENRTYIMHQLITLYFLPEFARQISRQCLDVPSSASIPASVLYINIDHN